MTIKDRGNIKWTSLMLVEHREALRKLKESEDEVEKPELDEQEKERLNRLIQEAVREGQIVKVAYYQNRRLATYTGRLTLTKKRLYLGERRLIVDNIIDIIPHA